MINVNKILFVGKFNGIVRDNNFFKELFEVQICVDSIGMVKGMLKIKHPEIKRIYVRAEFPVIGEDYRKYLLESYEETYELLSLKNLHSKKFEETLQKALFLCELQGRSDGLEE